MFATFDILFIKGIPVWIYSIISNAGFCLSIFIVGLVAIDSKFKWILSSYEFKKVKDSFKIRVIAMYNNASFFFKIENFNPTADKNLTSDIIFSSSCFSSSLVPIVFN